MPVQPYLFFNGRCDEALDFYKKALGAEVLSLSRFNESPGPMPEGMLPPGFENKVMHSAMRIGGSIVMASDGTTSDPCTFKGVELALIPDSQEEAKRWFDALSEGGQVRMPLGKSFFAESFGMVNDRFGMQWMVVYGAEGE
jgi:PhnB protein